MNIISVSTGHNGSVCLLVNGEIIYYMEEERLTRSKYDGEPISAYLEALSLIDYIDEVVINSTSENKHVFNWTGENMYVGIARKLGKTNEHTKTTFTHRAHHIMHAANGFYNSGFDDALVIVVDGAGSKIKVSQIPEKETGFEFETIFYAAYPHTFDVIYKHIGTTAPILKMAIDEDTPHKIWASEFPGIVKAYEAITNFLGFHFIDAGKTMGLAAYGDADEVPSFINPIGHIDRLRILPRYPAGALLAPFYGEKDRENLAARIQKDAEDYVIRLINQAIKAKPDCRNIVISGGFAMNVVANYKFTKEFPNHYFYMDPIGYDGGTAIGGAKWAWYEANAEATKRPLNNLYMGMPRSLVVPNNKAIEVKENMEAPEVVDLLDSGCIIGIFQSKSEAGHRALGNRSIVYDPTVADAKAIVNEVKGREEFRPFAGSILAEYADEWFDMGNLSDSPHMMFAVPAREIAHEKIPSIIHKDGTCRIQTVTKEQNKHYYALLSEFNARFECPILFNTSFNLAGEPLVETIEDAISTLLRSDIDAIWIPELSQIVVKKD